MSTSAEKYVTLNNGAKMDIIGYGTWMSVGEELEQALEKALEAGYRHIDTATLYKNEHIIGRVLKRWFDSEKLKREDLFITTKLIKIKDKGPLFTQMIRGINSESDDKPGQSVKLPRYGMKAELVTKCLNQSLVDLHVEYVDLYLIHGPIGLLRDVGYNETVDDKLDLNTDLVAVWKAMELQVEVGKAKAIGISNFNQSQIQRILQNSKIKPSNLQVELHVYLQQKPLVQFCKDNNMTVTSFSSLGSRGSFQTIFRGKNPPNLMEDKTVLNIAKKYSKTPAQILLKFLIQQQITVIPKSMNEKRIKENLQLLDFKLNEEDLEALKKLDKGEDGRIIRLSEYLPGITKHPEYPFSY